MVSAVWRSCSEKKCSMNSRSTIDGSAFLVAATHLCQRSGCLEIPMRFASTLSVASRKSCGRRAHGH